MADYKIGTVKHYYDKLGVAVIILDADLGVGEKIRFVRGGEELFDQNVDSIQVEYEKKDKATKGMSVGIKTKEIVKEGAEVYKVSQ